MRPTRRHALRRCASAAVAVAVAVATLVAAPAASAKDICDRSDAGKVAFAKKLQAALVKASPKLKLKYLPGDFALEQDGLRMSLSHLYTDYCNTPVAERPEALARIVRLTQQPPGVPKTYAAAKANLRPVLRSRTYMLFMRRTAQVSKAPTTYTTQPVGPHAELAIAFDGKDTIQILSDAQLKAWGVKSKKAFDQAWKNLRAQGKPTLKTVNGVTLIHGDVAYGAALVADLALIKTVETKGKRIVMTLDDATVGVADSANSESLKMLASFASQAIHRRASVRVLPGVALTPSGKGYVPWMPKAGTPMAGMYKQLSMFEWQGAYGGTKRMIEGMRGDKAKGPFVEPYVPMKSGNDVFSYCLWQKGNAASLLPRADRVFIVDGPQDKPVFRAVATWEKVQKVVGKRLKKQSGYPERWKVTSFPTDAELNALGKLPGSP